MTTLPAFASLIPERPNLDEVEATYDTLLADATSADDGALLLDVVRRWDALRSELRTFRALTNLKYSQDTSDAEARARREWADGVGPRFVELDTAIKRVLLESPHGAALKEALGEHLFDLWDADVTSFLPELKEDMVAISATSASYTELLASAEIEFHGEVLNISELRALQDDGSRDVRRSSFEALSAWVMGRTDQFDGIFDELVRRRHAMATKLGMRSFTELGYKKMHRIDYDRADVEVWRREVRDVLVPLGEELVALQQEALRLDELKAWDEGVFSLRGNPKPAGDHDWMVDRAVEMFDDLGYGMDTFFRSMVEQGYMDLKARKAKAPGGFCTSFPTIGMPFVYANFNGSKKDVEVFTHEMGHAFQNYSSQDTATIDYQWPTYESAEIHSMSLEFLTWPQMDRFFGAEEAARFRRIHLIEGLLFVPYGVAVDHFQHEIYKHPHATPEERCEIWRQMEAVYLPWRDWGHIEYGAAGRRWQLQAHIYQSPFYYIDYTLAQAVALQFWLESERDPEGAMRAYVALCKRGGSAPFRELVASAGLKTPFEPGCLKEVVRRSREFLKLNA